MIITTGNDIAGHEIVAYLGVVRGIVVRSANLGQNIVGGIKSLFGGNISDFTTVCEEAREEAYQLLETHARDRGADAVIGMRYDATEFYQGMAEVLAYGTAVRLKRL